MPAWTQARMFSRSIHSMASMRRMSTETIMRGSPAGSLRAALTLVPPPKGTRQTSWAAASRTSSAASSWDSG